MIISRTVMATAIIGFALAFATGCQQKGPAGKTEQSIGDRAKESAKIVQEATKRIQDSIKETKTEKKAQ